MRVHLELAEHEERVARPAALGDARGGVREVVALARQGVREINLLGQNVNAWHGEGPDGREWGLGQLLFALAGIDGLERLRYTTSHPRDMDDALIAAHRDLPALMPYLHLPVQAGSDRIPKAMNRKHTGDDYRRLVDRIRAARPDIALSGDFIVGFPGETDADFEDTMRLIRDVTYAQAFSFKYSPRPGTPGADLPDQEIVFAKCLRRPVAVDAQRIPVEYLRCRFHRRQAELRRLCVHMHDKHIVPCLQVGDQIMIVDGVHTTMMAPSHHQPYLLV